jgi:hypothetical protein
MDMSDANDVRIRRRKAVRLRGRVLSGFLLGLASASVAVPALGATALQPLAVETRIPLGEVKGRIDHLAINPGANRLAVAELGQGAVGLVDLKAGKILPRIEGLQKPQGVAFVGADVVVASGDGWVRRFSTETLRALEQVHLGDDADNVRVRPGSGDVLVGYGSGALAILDPHVEHPLFEIALASHPESFQIGPDGDRVYVNLPGGQRIDVLSLQARRVVASINTGQASANYPMAIDAQNQRLVVVFRAPAEVRAYDLADNHLIGSVSTCDDADDVFVDKRRNRLYVVCGEGAVDVLQPSAEGYTRIGRIETARGARTGFWSPETDRLYIAAPATRSSGAATLVLKPGQ